MNDEIDARRQVSAFFAHFIPQLAIAGRFALRLQSQLRERTEDKGGDAWQSAITDADLGVQRFLEAYTLAELPDWGFFGEESAQSDNTPYFPAASRTRVALDPINGTRLYRDGSPLFDILISLTVDERLVATLSYMPGMGVLYAASAFAGNFCRTGADLGTDEPLILPDGPGAVATYRAGHLTPALSTVTKVVDLADDYSPVDPRCCLNSIFTGELTGFLMLDCALLDVGATAFAVARAGGIATRPDGSALEDFEHFDPERRQDLLVCRDRELHAAMVSALAAAG